MWLFLSIRAVSGLKCKMSFTPEVSILTRAFWIANYTGEAKNKQANSDASSSPLWASLLVLLKSPGGRAMVSPSTICRMADSVCLPTHNGLSVWRSVNPCIECSPPGLPGIIPPSFRGFLSTTEINKHRLEVWSVIGLVVLEWPSLFQV